MPKTPFEHLLEAMRPKPQPDVMDCLALDIISDALTLPLQQARELIAARLRLVRQEGVVEGVKEAEATVHRSLGAA
jgi:hypothetical protein